MMPMNEKTALREMNELIFEVTLHELSDPIMAGVDTLESA